MKRRSAQVINYLVLRLPTVVKYSTGRCLAKLSLIFSFVRLWPQNEHSIHTGQSSEDQEQSAKWPHTTSFNQPTILYILWFFICFASRVSLSSLQLQLECRSHTIMWTWAWRSRITYFSLHAAYHARQSRKRPWCSTAFIIHNQLLFSLYGPSFFWNIWDFLNATLSRISQLFK